MLRAELDTYLKVLARRGVVASWHDRKIIPGEEWDPRILEELDRADIILLLVSPEFLASDYINTKEVPRALERHDAGEACVIPVIVRDSNWQEEPFSKLQALPTGARPIKGMRNRDAGWNEVSEGIKRAARQLRPGRD